jgi:hypothetical protein
MVFGTLISDSKIFESDVSGEKGTSLFLHEDSDIESDYYFFISKKGKHKEFNIRFRFVKEECTKVKSIELVNKDKKIEITFKPLNDSYEQLSSKSCSIETMIKITDYKKLKKLFEGEGGVNVYIYLRGDDMYQNRIGIYQSSTLELIEYYLKMK